LDHRGSARGGARSSRVRALDRRRSPVWLAVGALGGIVGGAAGWVAGFGAASAFYVAGTWLCALAGAFVALALRQAAHAGAFGLPELRERDIRPDDR
jgi:hypothetical protein